MTQTDGVFACIILFTQIINVSGLQFWAVFSSPTFSTSCRCVQHFPVVHFHVAHFRLSEHADWL